MLMGSIHQLIDDGPDPEEAAIVCCNVFQTIAKQRRDDWLKFQSSQTVDQLSAKLLLTQELRRVTLFRKIRMRVGQQEFGDP